MYNDDYEGGYSHERTGDEIYSKPVRAGKRTYFFDVKSTKGNNDFYLTITESKRKMEQDGRYSYDKHKIFLYKEDFDKFAEGLEEAVEYIRKRCLKDGAASEADYGNRSVEEKPGNAQEHSDDSDMF